jgi:hypothetical protein
MEGVKVLCGALTLCVVPFGGASPRHGPYRASSVNPLTNNLSESIFLVWPMAVWPGKLRRKALGGGPMTRKTFDDGTRMRNGRTARDLSRRFASQAEDTRRYTGDDDRAGRLQNRANRYATIARRLGATAVLAAVLFSTLARGVAGQDEPKPGLYGHEVCTTLAYDMATSTGVYTVRSFAKHMHLIGCQQSDRGTWGLANLPSAHGCDAAAYLIATRWLIRDHQPLLKLRPNVLGPEMDRIHHAMDCGLNGATWEWS